MAFLLVFAPVAGPLAPADAAPVDGSLGTTSGASPVVSGTKITWTGSLDPGQTVTVTAQTGGVAAPGAGPQLTLMAVAAACMAGATLLLRRLRASG